MDSKHQLHSRFTHKVPWYNQHTLQEPVALRALTSCTHMEQTEDPGFLTWKPFICSVRVQMVGALSASGQRPKNLEALDLRGHKIPQFNK
jgi:hypothetical protein